jgi:hypothetical protein
LERTFFKEQTKFVAVHVISESRGCGALALTENGAICPMKFQCRTSFAIYYSSSPAFATDRLSTQIDAHFGLPLIIATNSTLGVRFLSLWLWVVPGIWR